MSLEWIKAQNDLADNFKKFIILKPWISVKDMLPPSYKMVFCLAEMDCFDIRIKDFSGLGMFDFETKSWAFSHFKDLVNFNPYQLITYWKYL